MPGNSPKVMRKSDIAIIQITHKQRMYIISTATHKITTSHKLLADKIKIILQISCDLNDDHSSYERVPANRSYI